MEPYVNQPQDLTTPELPAPHRHFFNKKFAIALALTLLLGGTALGGLWWWQQMQIARNDESLLDVPVLTSQPKVDGTSTWKTYTSAKYGFEVRYPADWIAKSSELSVDSSVSLRTPKSGGLIIFVTDNKGKPLEQFLQESDRISQTAYEGMPSKKVISSISTQVAGTPAIQRMEDLYAAGFTTIETYFNYNSFNYSVSWMPDLSEPQSVAPTDNDKKLYAKILATFKFTDAASQFCGGIAGVQCPAGYSCKYEGNYPDAGGTCVKN